LYYLPDRPLTLGSIPQSGEDVYNIIHTLLADGDYDDADSGFTGGVDNELETDYIVDDSIETSFTSDYCIQDETVSWYNQVDFIIDGILSLASLLYAPTHFFAQVDRDRQIRRTRMD